MLISPQLVIPGAGRFITSQEVRGNIYIEVHGQEHATRPALLLTHGWGQSSQAWRHQIAELSKRWCVITWDLPHHGLSGPTEEEAEPVDLARALRAVVEELHLHEQGFVLTSWSLSGLLTRNYLLQFGTQGLLGLVLVATSLDFSAMVHLPPATLQVLGGLNAEDQRVRTEAFARFINMLWYIPPSLDEYLFILGYNAQAFLRPITNLLHQVEGDIGALLQQTTFPILVIQGVQDALAPVEYIREYVQGLPHSSLKLYDQCGHSPFQEHKERFNRDIEAFLQALAER